MKTVRKIFAWFLPAQYTDWSLIFCSVLLSVTGAVFIGSAFIAMGDAESPTFIGVVINTVKQLAFTVIGLIGMMIVVKAYDYRRMMVLLPFAMLAILGLLLLCLRYDPLNGARAWIPFFNIMTIQPSEFAKIVVILTVAVCTCPKESGVLNNSLVWLIFVPTLLALVYTLIVWRMQGDFGSAAIIFMIWALCMMIAQNRRLKGFQILLGLGMLVTIVAVVFLVTPAGGEMMQGVMDRMKTAEAAGTEYDFILDYYQVARIRTVSAPYSDYQDTGYQVGNSLIAFTNGGLTGAGLGKSVQKYGYLPFAYTDFILSVIAEEGGLLTVLLVLGANLFIIGRLVMHAFRMNKIHNKIILFGAACYLFIHLVLNAGGVTAMVPLTGVPLLMLSQGGTSLISWFAMLGICEKIIITHRQGRER